MTHVDEIQRIQEVKAWFDSADFIIIDGGTGSEIEREGGLMDKKGWTCTVNLTHPELVERVHAKYLKAGADVIIANTYATNPNVMLAAGFSESEQRSSTLRGCEIARQAVRRVIASSRLQRRPLVAGSLSCHPPLMPEGAEFDSGTWPPPEQEEANLVRHAELLKEGNVDLIFLEMVWDYEHAKRAMRAAVSVGLPVFVAVCIPLPMKGPHTDAALLKLADPTEEISVGGAGVISVVEFMREVTQHSNVVGVNVHHTPLPFMQAALDAVRRSGWKGTLGAYPDHGTFKNPHWEMLDLEPSRFLNHAEQWVESTGCKCIGGCCGVGPELIKALSEHRDVLAASYKRYTAEKPVKVTPPTWDVRRPANKRQMVVMLLLVVLSILLWITGSQFDVTEPVVRKDDSCGPHWTSMWFFILDQDSDGTVHVDELAAFFAEVPILQQRIVNAYGSMRAFASAMHPNANNEIFLNGFSNVFSGHLIGTEADPCPIPVGDLIR